MKLQITLEQYKNDDYPDEMEGKKLNQIFIGRHGKVVLEYV